MRLLRVLGATFLSITAPAGILSNIIVIVTLYKQIHWNDCSYIFFTHLAVIDLSVCVLGLTTGLGLNIIGGLAFCKACLVVIVLFYVLSTGNLCIMTYDRFLYITSPLTYFHKMNPKRAKILIVSLWAISLINIVPIITNTAFTKSPGPNHKLDRKNCILSKILSKAYFFWIATVVMVFIIATIVFNLCILRQARRQRKKIDLLKKSTSNMTINENTQVTGYCDGNDSLNGQTLNQSQQNTARKPRIAGALMRLRRLKAMRTIMCIVLIHCICNLPYILFVATEILCGFCFDYKRVKYAYSLYLLNYLNSVFDPVIYVCLNNDLRRAVRKMMKLACCNASW